MKILLIGPANLKTVPMTKFAEKALLGLGHDVLFESYNESFYEKIVSFFYKCFGGNEIYLGINKRIRGRLKNFNPELLFTIYGIHLSQQTLFYAKKKGIKTACWWLNDPFQFERGYKLAANYDYWFSNSSECAKKIRSTFNTKAFFLPTACDPKTHKKMPKYKKYSCDVCFAGDWSKSREDLLLYLVGQGINIKIYGPWERKLNKNSKLIPYLTNGFFSPTQMAKYFSNAKIVLNQHTWFKKALHGVNPRLLETAACGTLQIVDFKKEIPSLFNIQTEIVTYKKINELPSLIHIFLKDKRRRDNLAKNARINALKNHTYSQRMQEMLHYIEG